VESCYQACRANSNAFAERNIERAIEFVADPQNVIEIAPIAYHLGMQSQQLLNHCDSFVLVRSILPHNSHALMSECIGENRQQVKQLLDLRWIWRRVRPVLGRKCQRQSLDQFNV